MLGVLQRVVTVGHHIPSLPLFTLGILNRSVHQDDFPMPLSQKIIYYSIIPCSHISIDIEGVVSLFGCTDDNVRDVSLPDMIDIHIIDARIHDQSTIDGLG